AEPARSPEPPGRSRLRTSTRRGPARRSRSPTAASQARRPGGTVSSARPSRSGADGGGEDAAELDRYPVGPGVQFGGGVERELQTGQRSPLEFQVLLEDRHLVL